MLKIKFTASNTFKLLKLNLANIPKTKFLTQFYYISNNKFHIRLIISPNNPPPDTTLNYLSDKIIIPL